MSLKAVHIIVIMISITLMLLLGIWGIESYKAVQDAVSLVIGVASFVVGVSLSVYLGWFFKKMSGIHSQ